MVLSHDLAEAIGGAVKDYIVALEKSSDGAECAEKVPNSWILEPGTLDLPPNNVHPVWQLHEVLAGTDELGWKTPLALWRLPQVSFPPSILLGHALDCIGAGAVPTAVLAPTKSCIRTLDRSSTNRANKRHSGLPPTPLEVSAFETWASQRHFLCRQSARLSATSQWKL